MTAIDFEVKRSRVKLDIEICWPLNILRTFCFTAFKLSTLGYISYKEYRWPLSILRLTVQRSWVKLGILCILAISRFAYKSVGIFEVILEVFTVNPPISRYHFSPELVNNFRSMFCCLYGLQIKILKQKTSIFNILLNNQIYTIALIHFTCCHWNSGIWYRYLTS
jgi:hypothetical protein